jgi:hypothetical protein
MTWQLSREPRGGAVHPGRRCYVWDTVYIILNPYSWSHQPIHLSKHGRPYTEPILFLALGIGLQYPDTPAVRINIAQTRSVLRTARPHTIHIIITHLPTQQGFVPHLRRVRIASPHAPR